MHRAVSLPLPASGTGEASRCPGLSTSSEGHGHQTAGVSLYRRPHSRLAGVGEHGILFSIPPLLSCFVFFFFSHELFLVYLVILFSFLILSFSDLVFRRNSTLITQPGPGLWPSIAVSPEELWVCRVNRPVPDIGSIADVLGRAVQAGMETSGVWRGTVTAKAKHSG